MQGHPTALGPNVLVHERPDADAGGAAHQVAIVGNQVMVAKDRDHYLTGP